MKKETKAYINRHRKWQAYATKELAHGRKPIPFKDYTAENVESIYFGGIKRVTPEARLENALKRKKKRR